MRRKQGALKDSDIQRWLAEKDENDEWLTVRSFSSQGETSRIPSLVTGGEHTTFSKTEKGVFFSIEYARNLRAFQAQRRIDRSVSLAAAASIGVEHQVYPGTSIPYVMTVDARVCHERFGNERWTQHKSGQRHVPDNLALALDGLSQSNSGKALDELERWGVLLRTYEQLQAAMGHVQWTVYDSKLEAELLDAGTLTALSIARKASNHLGWGYYIVSEKVVPDQIVMNIEWIRRGQRKPLESARPAGLFTDLPRRMLADLARKPSRTPLPDYCEAFGVEHGLGDGVGLRVLQILLWSRALTVDVRVPNLHERHIGALTAGDGCLPDA